MPATAIRRIEDYLSLLKGVKKTISGWEAWCPSHDDKKKRSLSVSCPDHAILIHCFAGCSPEKIVQTQGLKMSDLFLDKNNGKVHANSISTTAIDTKTKKSAKTKSKKRPEIERIYDYLGPDGNGGFKLYHQTIRRKGKVFSQRRPGPNFVTGANDSEWIRNLDGVDLQLYYLQDLPKAKATGDLIFKVEGEKDCEAVWDNGLVATCNAMGANKPILPQYLDALSGAHMRIIPDNDEAGLKDAKAWATALYPITASLKIVTLPSDVKDAYEYFDSGRTADDLLALDGNTPNWKPPASLDYDDQDPHKYNDTDLGNGERFANDWRDVARYNFRPHGQWTVWNGKYWELDCGAKIEGMSAITTRRIYNEAADIDDASKREALIKHAKTSEKIERMSAMVKAARSRPGVPIEVDELDTNPWKLCVRNGTLDLRTRILGPHRKEDLITKMIDVFYDPQAYSPKWLKFIERIVSSAEEATYLQKWCGYSLTGLNSEQKLLFLYGKGEEGKTTITQVMLGLMGDYATQASAETFIQSKNPTQADRPRPDIMALKDKRLVISNELPSGRRLAVELVKSLTGGDKQSYRALFESQSVWRNSAKIWFAGNHKPTIQDQTHAIWRRIKILQFRKPIKPEERIDDYEGVLLEEAPGILTWCIQGTQMWLKDKLKNEPRSVINAINEYKTEEDTMADFIAEYCILTGRVIRGELHKIYKEWCEASGYKPLGKVNFYRQITERDGVFQESGAHNIQYFTGISLNKRENR